MRLKPALLAILLVAPAMGHAATQNISGTIYISQHAFKMIESGAIKWRMSFPSNNCRVDSPVEVVDPQNSDNTQKYYAHAYSCSLDWNVNLTANLVQEFSPGLFWELNSTQPSDLIMSNAYVTKLGSAASFVKAIGNNGVAPFDKIPNTIQAIYSCEYTDVTVQTKSGTSISKQPNGMCGVRQSCTTTGGGKSGGTATTTCKDVDVDSNFQADFVVRVKGQVTTASSGAFNPGSYSSNAGVNPLTQGAYNSHNLSMEFFPRGADIGTEPSGFIFIDAHVPGLGAFGKAEDGTWYKIEQEYIPATGFGLNATAAKTINKRQPYRSLSKLRGPFKAEIYAGLDVSGLARTLVCVGFGLGKDVQTASNDLDANLAAARGCYSIPNALTR